MMVDWIDLKKRFVTTIHRVLQQKTGNTHYLVSKLDLIFSGNVPMQLHTLDIVSDLLELNMETVTFTGGAVLDSGEFRVGCTLDV